MAVTDLLPLLNEGDLEQMRRDTERLQAENKRLKRRITALECQIITYAWAGWEVH